MKIAQHATDIAKSAFLVTWARSAHSELLWLVNVRRPSPAIALKAYPSYTSGSVGSKLGRKLGVTCRLK